MAHVDFGTYHHSTPEESQHRSNTSKRWATGAGHGRWFGAHTQYRHTPRSELVPGGIGIASRRKNFISGRFELSTTALG